MASKTLTYTDILPSDSVAMDSNAFDELLQNHGVTVKHWRAMRCPVGLVDPHDFRRSHDHHENCSNGYIYRPAGIVRALFTGNGNDPKYIDVGLIDGSSSQVTLPHFYEDNPEKTVHVAYADRFYLVGKGSELSVPHWHTFKAHETGTDRLQFPAIRVENVIDKRGREYSPHLYAVNQEGNLQWLTQDRPAPDDVCVAWYIYQPFWYVGRIIHEIRVSQSFDSITGEAEIKRFPYSVILQRENSFRNTEIDDESPDSPRKQQAEADNGFGPR